MELMMSCAEKKSSLFATNVGLLIVKNERLCQGVSERMSEREERLGPETGHLPVYI